ncbi:hypothetical protein NC652_016811 [Populus alba x Populus x berolinensis]|nr:hypothetical protein NC652_016811 [Populus alba x Populus x berolinensis]
MPLFHDKYQVYDNYRYAKYFDRYKVVWYRTIKRSLVANSINLIGFRFLGASLFLVPFKDYKSMMAAIDAERSIMNDFFDGLRLWISSDGATDRFARISISDLPTKGWTTDRSVGKNVSNAWPLDPNSPSMEAYQFWAQTLMDSHNHSHESASEENQQVMIHQTSITSTDNSQASRRPHHMFSRSRRRKIKLLSSTSSIQ